LLLYTEYSENTLTNRIDRSVLFYNQ